VIVCCVRVGDGVVDRIKHNINICL
jgi:hypothetical protein